MNIRRNNPGNIRKVAAIQWKGEVPGTVAPDVISFYTLEDGFRAMLLNLNTYIKKHGANTIDKIVRRWDPKKDSPGDITPEQYVKKVSDETGISADTVISANDYNTLGKVALAITHVEHSARPADSVLQAAITKAKGMLTGIIEIVKRHPVETILIIALGYYLLTSD